MNKYTIIALSLVLAACAHQEPCCQQVDQPQEYAYEPVIVESVMPCAAQSQVVVEPQPCAQANEPTCTSCRYTPDACRPVLQPRITEVAVAKTCPDCPPDGQAVICGDSVCHTFAQTTDQVQSAEVYVPALPKAYVLAANRSFTRLQNSVASWANGTPDIFVQAAEVRSPDLPAGVEQGIVAMKNQIANSSQFILTNNAAGASYTLETSVDWFDTASKTVPAIQYRTVLYDRAHNKINEWVEVVRRADNKSWL